MFKKAQWGIIVILRVIEMAVAMLLTVAIGFLTVNMVPEILSLLSAETSINDLKYILEYSFSLIIGIEFVKMVCKPTAGNVVEVLMFAVTRFVIIEHSAITTSLLGVLSIAVLFATKKYLFCEVNDPAK